MRAAPSGSSGGAGRHADPDDTGARARAALDRRACRRAPPARARMLARPWWPGRGATSRIEARRRRPRSRARASSVVVRGRSSTRVGAASAATALLSASRAIWRISRPGADRQDVAPAGSTAMSSSTSTAPLLRNSSASARARRPDRLPSSSSGRSPKMKLRMSRIVRLSESIAPSTRSLASSGALGDQVGHVLERQRRRA